MIVIVRVFVILLFATNENCLGFVIRSKEESALKSGAAASHPQDEWGVFKLDLSPENVELLKSLKDQQGTKDLLNRFIQQKAKAKANKVPPSESEAYARLLRVLVKNLRRSKSMLKTSFNFEVADRSVKPLKRARRKIAVKMVSDMSSENVDQLIKMFYRQHNIRPDEYYSDRVTDRMTEDYADDYIDEDANGNANGRVPPSMARMNTDADADYAYDNYYDDEGDVALTAKSNQNREYGSFQDLILQAKRNQRERENEENKLNESYI